MRYYYPGETIREQARGFTQDHVCVMAGTVYSGRFATRQELGGVLRSDDNHDYPHLPLYLHIDGRYPPTPIDYRRTEKYGSENFGTTLELSGLWIAEITDPRVPPHEARWKGWVRASWGWTPYQAFMRMRNELDDTMLNFMRGMTEKFRVKHEGTHHVSEPLPGPWGPSFSRHR